MNFLANGLQKGTYPFWGPGLENKTKPGYQIVYQVP